MRASWRSLAWGEAPRAPPRGCDVPKLTQAHVEEMAAQPSWDDLTEQERQAVDRLQAELNDYVFNERLARESVARAPRQRRGPTATRSRQSRSRRRPRAADGDGGDESDADGGDDADGDAHAHSAALQWLRDGSGVLLLCWPVFDDEDAQVRCSCGKSTCTSIGKHPIAQLHPHGLNSAFSATDAGEFKLDRGFGEYPEANYGILTRGLAVLDFDAGKGGLEAKKRMEDEHGPLPGRRHLTGQAEDGRRGEHVICRQGAAPITNRNQGLRLAGYGGADVRGDGGYIVGPGSMHPSGVLVEGAGYYCPYCGVQAPTDAWLTASQVALAQSIVMSKVIGPLLDDFGRDLQQVSRATGGMVRANVAFDKPKEPEPLTEGDDMRRVDFSCHPTKPVKVLDDWHRSVFCLTCGAAQA